MKKILTALSLGTVLLSTTPLLAHDEGMPKDPAHKEHANHDMNHHQEMAKHSQMMLDMLKAKSGNEFDKAFLSDMIMHHEDAIKMANIAKERGNHAEVKTLADKIIAAQTTEIAEMQVWLKQW